MTFIKKSIAQTKKHFPKQINLAKRQERVALNELYEVSCDQGNGGLFAIIQQIGRRSSLESYVFRGQEPVVVCDKRKILSIENSTRWVMLRAGSLYQTDCLSTMAISLPGEEVAPPRDLLGFVFDQPNGRDKKTVLQNGDDGGSYTVVHRMFANHPTTSMQCIGRLFSPKETSEIFYREYAEKMMARGVIRLLDFTPDQRESLNKSEKIKVQKLQRDLENHNIDSIEYSNRMPVRAEAGWTLLGGSSPGWHRPSTVLLQNAINQKCYITGQDEGTYFGCELPHPCKTVQEAYEMLIPPEVKGKKYRRQGEWFILPVSRENLPKFDQIAVEIRGGTTLPRENENSGLHNLERSPTTTGWIPNIIVDKKGTFYAENCTLNHPDHLPVYITGWVSFHRNTAVRSVSIEGMD